MTGEIHNFVFLILFLHHDVSGLFLDQIMSDCHGLPFECMQQSSRSRMDYNKNQATGTLSSSTPESNMFATSVHRQHITSKNVGSSYNPSDMSQIIKANTMSEQPGMGANYMNSGQGQSNPFTIQNGESQNMVQGVQNGQGGMFSNSLSNGENSGPFSAIMGTGMHGGEASYAGTNYRPQTQTIGGQHEIKHDNVNKVLLEVVSNLCGRSWMDCPTECFSMDKQTGCPSCSCSKRENRLFQGRLNQDSGKETAGFQEEKHCTSLPDDCPSVCITFDERGCTVCSCDANPCPRFPEFCPRGFSKIDKKGCAICTFQDDHTEKVCMCHNGGFFIVEKGMSTLNENNHALLPLNSEISGKSWYDKVWKL